MELSGPERLKRYRQIITLLVKYGSREIVQTEGLEEGLLLAEVEAETGAEEKAEALARDLEQMGPTFVKLGQLLSTRPDLIAEPYLEALARLQDEVEPFPLEEVEALIQEELKTRISQAFATFEPEPLAAASLGQVHRATLRDGRPVVVKVQRPGVRRQVLADLEVLDEIVGTLDSYTTLGHRYAFEAMFESFRSSLLRELDYRREVRNMIRLGHDLQAYEMVTVPQPVADYSTSRLLTMDYLAGTPVSDLGPLARLEMDGYALAETVARAYLDQILVEGFFHSDPHPGNVLLLDDGTLAIVDLGQVAYLTPRIQEQMIKLLLAVSEGNSEQVADMSVEMGTPLDDYRPDAFRREVTELILPRRDAPLAEIQLGRIVMEMARIAARNGVRPAPELTMLGKTLLNLDEITRTLAPDFEPNQLIREHTDEIMTRHMMQIFAPANLFSTLLEMSELVQQLPVRLNTLLEQLVNHEVEIQVNALDEERLLQNLQKIANRITMGLILAALIVGAALMMRVDTPFRILGYPGLAMLFFLLAATLGLILVLNILVTDIWRDRHNRPR